MNSFTHSFNTHLFSRRLPWGWQGFTRWKTVVSEAGRDTKWICKPGNKQATVSWGSVLWRKQNRVFNSAVPRGLQTVLPLCPGYLGRAPLRRKDGSWDLSHSRKLCQVKLWTSIISHWLQGSLILPCTRLLHVSLSQSALDLFIPHPAHFPLLHSPSCVLTLHSDFKVWFTWGQKKKKEEDERRGFWTQTWLKSWLYHLITVSAYTYMWLCMITLGKFRSFNINIHS